MEAIMYRQYVINVPDEIKIDHNICPFEPSEDHDAFGYMGSYNYKCNDYIASLVLKRHGSDVRINIFLSHINDDKGARTTYWIVDDMRSLKKNIEVHSRILTEWIRELKGETNA